MSKKKYFVDAAGEIRQIKRSFYSEWQETEGIPVFEGFSVEDVDKLPLDNWERKGGKGCFINLVGSESMCDFYLCEIPPGESLKPQKQLFEEQIFVLDGHGATTVWNEGGTKHTFEWHEGSVFSPPLNTWHQLFNGQGDKPSRYLAMTMAPVTLNLYRDVDYVFNNQHVFTGRYNSEEDYFSGKMTPLGRDDQYGRWDSAEDFLAGKEPARTNTLRTNFISDVRNVGLDAMPGSGEGYSSMHFKLSHNTVQCHVAQFDVGKYKRAHRHGGGAHVVILEGQGYSLLWLEGKEDERMKIPWKKGSVVVPPSDYFHHHFSTSETPIRYLALRGGFGKEGKHLSTLSVSEGGDCIDYNEEEPLIREMYKEALAKEGVPFKMRPELYG